MTALRRSAITELEKLPEDKLPFVIQIMQGVNGLYSDTKSEKELAFERSWSGYVEKELKQTTRKN